MKLPRSYKLTPGAQKHRYIKPSRQLWIAMAGWFRALFYSFSLSSDNSVDKNDHVVHWSLYPFNKVTFISFSLSERELLLSQPPLFRIAALSATTFPPQVLETSAQKIQGASILHSYIRAKGTARFSSLTNIRTDSISYCHAKCSCHL